MKLFRKLFFDPTDGPAFTPRAQQVFAFALKAAERFPDNAVTPQHLLSGILQLGQGVAINVLRRCAIDLERLRVLLEPLMQEPSDAQATERVLSTARSEAKALHHTYVGTEHLLLAILQSETAAGRLLRENSDLALEPVREEILKELDPNFSAGNELMNIELDGQQRNFTPRSQHVLADASHEAARLCSPMVDTRHLLLGLLMLEDWAMGNSLAQLGLTLGRARAVIEDKPRDTGAGVENREYSPCLKRVLALSCRAAQKFEHNYIGPEHLFYALLNLPDSDAGQLLAQHFSLDLTGLSKAIERNLDQNSARSALEVTPRVKRILALARKEAEVLSHGFIGTDHLLAGMLAANMGPAVQLLQSKGITLDVVRHFLQRQSYGPFKPIVGIEFVDGLRAGPDGVPYTPRMKTVLQRAQSLARQFHYTMVGTELMALALLWEQDGPAASLLRAHPNLDVIEIRRAIEDQLTKQQF